jgi:hypothetical protein
MATNPSLLPSDTPSSGNIRTEAGQLAADGRTPGQSLIDKLPRMFQTLSRALVSVQDQLDTIGKVLRSPIPQPVPAGGDTVIGGNLLVSGSITGAAVTSTGPLSVTVGGTQQTNFNNTTGLLDTYDALATSGLGVAAVFGNVQAVGQSTNINGNLYAPGGPGGNAPAGFYVAHGYVVVTTVGNAVSIQVAVQWDDGTGTKTFATAAATIFLSVLGETDGFTKAFFHAGGAQITFFSQLSGAAGTGQYFAAWALERLA